MVSVNATLPTPASTHWQFDKDVLIMGPIGQRDASRYGSPTSASLDMAGRTNIIGMPTGDLDAVYIQRITLRNLPKGGLSSAGAVYTGAGEELTYALPLWSFGMDTRADRSQLQLDQVTLELPALEFAVLLGAARRGNDWQGGPLASNQLVQGLSTFSIAPSITPSLTSIPVVLLEGWGVRCSNCRLIPSSAVSETNVPTDAPPPSPPPAPPPPPPPPPLYSQQELDEAKKKVNKGMVAGIVVGSVVFIAAIGGFIYVRHKQLEKHVHAYAQVSA